MQFLINRHFTFSSVACVRWLKSTSDTFMKCEISFSLPRLSSPSLHLLTSKHVFFMSCVINYCSLLQILISYSFLSSVDVTIVAMLLFVGTY